MNYSGTEIKVVTLKLFALALYIFNISTIQCSQQKTIPYNERLELNRKQLYPLIQKMEADDIYAIFTDNNSKQLQELSLQIPDKSIVEIPNKNILNIQEMFQEYFRKDFTLLATTTGKRLLIELLCTILTKSERSKFIPIFSKSIIQQACKSIDIQPGTVNKEYEWEDGKQASDKKGTLRYTPTSKVYLPEINSGKINMVKCESDVALFHELLHWLHGMSNYNLYKDGKAAEYSKIIGIESMVDGMAKKNFKIFSTILSHYFENHVDKKEVKNALVYMWCLAKDREDYGLGKDFIIEMEEMRTVCGSSEDKLSENAYRKEKSLPLRVSYTVYSKDSYELEIISQYLQNSDYEKNYLKIAFLTKNNRISI